MDKLRELAEAATPGPWEATDGVVWIDTREQVCCGRGYQECCGEPDVIGGQEKVADTNAPDAAFIAAANPTVVLSLLSTIKELMEALQACQNRWTPMTQQQLDIYHNATAALSRAKSLMEQKP